MAEEIARHVLLSAGSFLLGMVLMYNMVRVRLNWYKDAKSKIDAHNRLVDMMKRKDRRIKLLENELERRDSLIKTKQLVYEVGQIVDREA